MRAVFIPIIAALTIGACTPTKEPIIKQFGICKMQAIEKGFRDDLDYLTACMNTAGYRPILGCTVDHLKKEGPDCYELTPTDPDAIASGRHKVRLDDGTKIEISNFREIPSDAVTRSAPAPDIHPPRCPDNDPLGLFTDADCDPVRPKKMPSLKMTKCTPEQFYTDPQKCM
jgi:hypothetical protein